MGGIFNKLVNLFMNRLSVNQTLMNMINHGALSLKEPVTKGEKRGAPPSGRGISFRPLAVGPGW